MRHQAKLTQPLLGALLGMLGFAAEARDYIHIVGSSTVYPFSQEVGERLNKAGGKKKDKFKLPWLESTGTKGGIQLFCEGDGEAFADIVNTARRMTKKEFAECQNNGVRDILEIKIGYEGLVIAQSKTAAPMNLTRKDLYLAMSRMIPGSGDQVVPNRARYWKEVNPGLLDRRIEVAGPPANSGFRELFRELVLESGCDTYPWLAAKRGTPEYKKACSDLRADGVYLEVPSNDPRVVKALAEGETGVALMTYTFYSQHKNKLSALEIEGYAPKHESIATQQYPLAGPLYFYVKKSHMEYIPGLAKFVQEFTGEKAVGEKGYLAGKGLITLPKEERKTIAEAAKTLQTLMM